jgi:hypothetical protein
VAARDGGIKVGGRSVAVPEGVTLASDEHVVAAGEFSQGNVLFFLRWRMAVTNKRLVGRTPNTVLGVIPLGSTQISYPIGAIAGITTGTRYSSLWAFIGVLFVVTAAPGGRLNPVSIVIGLLAILASIRTQLSITNSGGQVTRHGVAIWNRTEARDFAQAVTTAVAGHAPVAPRASDFAISARPSAEDRLRELSRLRDAGLITQVEFDSKRQELLAGL